MTNDPQRAPFVGATVLYHSSGTHDGSFPPALWPALVMDVAGYRCDLQVFYPNGMLFKQSVDHAVAPKPMHWSWPSES